MSQFVDRDLLPELACRQAWFKKQYPGVKGYYTRHGQPKYYLRGKGKRKDTPLPVFEVSPDAFHGAYHAAVAALVPTANGHKAGSVGAFITAFAASPAWPEAETETAKKFTRMMARLLRAECDGGGLLADLPLRGFGPKVVVMLRDTFKNARTVSKEFLWFGKVAWQWGFESEAWGITVNPFLGVKPLKAENRHGHHTWDDPQIAHARDKWQEGSQERLCLELGLLTGFRLSDLCRVGRKDIRAGRPGELFPWYWDFQQWKNRKDCPQQQGSPVHPALVELLKATPGAWDAIGNATFLRNRYNAAWAEDGLSDWWLRKRLEIGLPGGRVAGSNKRVHDSCSLHGLRKAAACALADTGANNVEIAAFLGHADTKQVDKYIAARNRRRAAESGMVKLLATGSESGARKARRRLLQAAGQYRHGV